VAGILGRLAAFVLAATQGMVTPTDRYGIPAPGHRLPAATRPGRVKLQVADLERSLAHYQGALGLRVLDRTRGAASLGPAGEATPLVELHERPGARPVPRRGRLGLYHFALLLPDRAALGRFLAHVVGHPAGRGSYTGRSDHAVSEAIYLSDPDGLGIEVYADRPRESWRVRGRELAITTEPLDADDLIAAGGDEPWSGAPAGTVMGHVHLHVGDLEDAAAFYHRGLGLDQVVWSYPGALFLSAGGYHHHLGTNTWAHGAAPAADDDARLLEWELLVPTDEDAARALDNLERNGASVERAANGGATRDPWGIALGIRTATPTGASERHAEGARR
jgi:catechol 2,3-dioxygenase